MSVAQQIKTTAAKDNPTEFACDTNSAKAVFLAGSFNNWSPTASPMTKDKNGHWTASLPLAPGRYEYKFVVDGEWCCEPGCAAKNVRCQHCIVNEFGTMNRVVDVP